MNNGKSVNVLTGAIVGNTIDSIKCALKLCEMKRWKCTVFLLSVLTIVLISCVAVLLIVGEPSDVRDDVPLHPGPSSSSYPNSFVKSSRSNAPAANDEQDALDDENHNLLHLPEQRHNYRRRFTDAIKGVFADLINNSINSSSSPLPIPDQVVPSHSSPSNESTENNSSRLKRQLDFGSGASSEEQHENSKEEYRTTPPSAKKYTPPSKRPFLRVIKAGRSSTIRATSDDSPPSSSPSPAVSTSSEENANSSVKSEEEEDEGDVDSSRGTFQKRHFRRFRPASKARNLPKLQRLSSKEKYDISHEDNSPSTNDRNNFTLEVVQVERKVTRKEDGHIPPLFKKGNYNIEPRLLKVSKKDDANRPQVVYKPRELKSNSNPVPPPRPSNRQGKSASREISTESSSVEASVEKGKGRGKKGSSSEERRGAVLVNLRSQIPYNERDLSEEDLKDYHDGHSTFGSKGNFTHTILSRNVAGFIPNHSAENLSKRSKSDRKIVIEKGKVTERYPERRFKNPSTDIYSVPGGRSSSTENYDPKKEVFPFTRTSKRTKDVGVENNDRTSPAIAASLEELYRNGHPGVVPAPKQDAYQKHESSDPYGDSGAYSSPFSYNPLVDEPPLKFDPESDRYYGEPVPDNKERVAQSNSPAVKVETGREENPGQNADYFRPVKRESEEDKEPSREQVQGTSKETPLNQNDRFYYGRAYNPRDYAAEFDTEPAGDRESSRNNANEPDSFDFVGLEDNFEPNHADAGSGGQNDFFDFPEDIGGEGGSGSRYRPRSGGSTDEDIGGERDSESRYRPRPGGSKDEDVGGERDSGTRFRPRSGGSTDHPEDIVGERDNSGSRFRPRLGGSTDHPEEDEANRNTSDDDDRSDGGRSSGDTSREYEEEEETPQREEAPIRRPAPPRSPRGNKHNDNDYGGFGSSSVKNVADSESNPETYDTGFIQTLKQFDEEIKKLQDEERRKLLHSTAARSRQETSTVQHQPSPSPPRTTESGYKRSSPLVIASPGPTDTSYESSSPRDSSTPVSLGDVGTTVKISDDGDDEETAANPPDSISSREPSTESGEDFIKQFTTPPNRSVGSDTEEDTTNSSNAGPLDYSTEISGEQVDDDEK